MKNLVKGPCDRCKSGRVLWRYTPLPEHPQAEGMCVVELDDQGYCPWWERERNVGHPDPIWRTQPLMVCSTCHTREREREVEHIREVEAAGYGEAMTELGARS